MDLLVLITGCGLGVILGIVISKIINRTKTVSLSEYSVTKQLLDEKELELKLSQERLNDISTKSFNNEQDLTRLSQQVIDAEKKLSSSETEIQNFKTQLESIRKENESLYNKIESKQNEINDLNNTLSEKRQENKYLKSKIDDQVDELNKIRDESRLYFEKIANEILDEKSKKFTETNKVNIENILKPISENIDKFKKQVEETYDKESKERFSLGDRIKELIEQTHKVSDEANNLAAALKGQSKTRGDWGEMILESILQDSGLVKGREYSLQQTLKNNEGKTIKPDVLVKLPDDRVIVIDSKVSLIAYNNFYTSESIEEQNLQLIEHVKAIKRHIDELSNKNYDDLESSLDFTMMFIPIEPAYMVAIQADNDLWRYAYSKRILLISPTNLIACMKLISDLWKREQQSKNAMEIVKRGELLYNKFVLFTDSIVDIGEKIDKSKGAYNSAMKQLKEGSGNLIGQAIKLKNLGLKSDKDINQTLITDDTAENID